MLAGVCIAFGASGACAAERHASGGLVRFSGAIVEQYDVTLAVPSVEVRHGVTAGDACRVLAGVTAGDACRASAAVTFDAHGRRLPGASVVLADVNGAPLRPLAESGVRASWRDAGSGQLTPPRPDGTYRVGPHGGTMTVAAADAEMADPVVMKILHP